MSGAFAIESFILPAYLSSAALSLASAREFTDGNSNEPSTPSTLILRMLNLAA